MATAEAVLNVLPSLEEHALRVDPRARVFIRPDHEGGFYLLVQLRTASAQAMASLGPKFREVPVAAEVLKDVVTHIRTPGAEHWQSTKYSGTCLLNAGLQEPVFILRATDELAVTAVEAWITAARAANVDSLKIRKAESHLAAMKEWQPRGLPT